MITKDYKLGTNDYKGLQIGYKLIDLQMATSWLQVSSWLQMSTSWLHYKLTTYTNVYKLTTVQIVCRLIDYLTTNTNVYKCLQVDWLQFDYNLIDYKHKWLH